MKNPILLALLLLALAACKKDTTILPNTAITNVTHSIGRGGTAAKADTIPDQAAFRIRLSEDSTNRDETMFLFDHSLSLKYSANCDALYFPGFGQVSLSSISTDGKSLAIYELPYSSGMVIGLNVKTKTDGNFSLGVSYADKIPANMHIWLRDTYLKDSVDVCMGNYNFSVRKADTSSFGSKRFQLTFKTSAAPPSSIQPPPPPASH